MLLGWLVTKNGVQESLPLSDFGTTCVFSLHEILERVDRRLAGDTSTGQECFREGRPIQTTPLFGQRL
jgi:hypothetical protein